MSVSNEIVNFATKLERRWNPDGGTLATWGTTIRDIYTTIRGIYLMDCRWDSMVRTDSNAARSSASARFCAVNACAAATFASRTAAKAAVCSIWAARWATRLACTSGSIAIASLMMA